MKAEYTPGPWLVGLFGEIWPASDVEQRDGKWHEMCAEPRIVASASKLAAEYEANAVLIAAAPELLNALRLNVAYEAVPADRGGSSGPKGKAWAAFIAARDAAIAKAECAR